MRYREDKEVTIDTKKAYVDGFEKIIDQRQKLVDGIRAEYIRDIFDNPEKYRNDLKEMLGWPLVGYDCDESVEVSSQLLSEEDGYCVYRMEIEVLDGFKLYGLLFRAEGEEKKPLVIVQHGGNGTPEHISGFYGDTTNYNDMLHRVRKCGVHVFAPQLILWSDGYNVEYDRLAIDAGLKRVGSSQVAIEVYGITKILDYFETQDYVSSFGMVGLSWGGFYTLYTSAIDTRIKSAISCSFFNKRSAVHWHEWTWFKAGQKFDDAEVACMIYPRKLCIEIGKHDELFDCKYGQESFDRLKELCKNVGTEWLDTIVFDGGHEFCKDDEPIHKLVSELKNIDND